MCLQEALDAVCTPQFMQDAPVAGNEASARSEVREVAGNRAWESGPAAPLAFLALPAAQTSLEALASPSKFTPYKPRRGTIGFTCTGRGGRIVGWLFPHTFLWLLIFVVSFGISFVAVAENVQWLNGFSNVRASISVLSGTSFEFGVESHKQ